MNLRIGLFNMAVMNINRFNVKPLNPSCREEAAWDPHAAMQEPQDLGVCHVGWLPRAGSDLAHQVTSWAQACNGIVRGRWIHRESICGWGQGRIYRYSRTDLKTLSFIKIYIYETYTVRPSKTNFIPSSRYINQAIKLEGTIASNLIRGVYERKEENQNGRLWFSTRGLTTCVDGGDKSSQLITPLANVR